MARFNNLWVEIEFQEGEMGRAVGNLNMVADGAMDKQRVLAELRKYGMQFSETPGCQINLESAEKCLRIAAAQKKTPTLSFAEADRTSRPVAQQFTIVPGSGLGLANVGLAQRAEDLQAEGNKMSYREALSSARMEFAASGADPDKPLR